MPLDYEKTINAGNFSCRQNVFVNDISEPLEPTQENSDYTISQLIIERQNKMIGCIEGTRSIHALDMHRALMDMFDSPDYLDLQNPTKRDLQTPTKRVTDQMITIGNGWSLSNRLFKVLHGASIFDVDQGSVWVNIEILGNLKSFEDEGVESNLCFGLVMGQELFAYSANINNNIELLVQNVTNFNVHSGEMIFRLRGRYGDGFIQPSEFTINDFTTYQSCCQKRVVPLYYQKRGVPLYYGSDIRTEAPGTIPTEEIVLFPTTEEMARRKIEEMARRKMERVREEREQFVQQVLKRATLKRKMDI